MIPEQACMSNCECNIPVRTDIQHHTVELDRLHNYPMPIVPVVRTANGEAECVQSVELLLQNALQLKTQKICFCTEILLQ